MAAEEACGVLSVSKEQHAHHAVQGKGGGALSARGVRHVERSERVLADLREAKSLSRRGAGAP